MSCSVSEGRGGGFSSGLQHWRCWRPQKHWSANFQQRLTIHSYAQHQQSKAAALGIGMGGGRFRAHSHGAGSLSSGNGSLRDNFPSRKLRARARSIGTGVWKQSIGVVKSGSFRLTNLATTFCECPQRFCRMIGMPSALFSTNGKRQQQRRQSWQRKRH